MTTKIAVLAGDGVGPEIIAAAVEILKACLPVELERGLIGGAAIEATGDPLPQTTLELVESSDAVLLGPVGGPRWGGQVRGEEGLERLRQHPRRLRQPAPGALSGRGRARARQHRAAR